MKYLAILFSLYMTLLTMAPCRDVEDFGGGSLSNAGYHKDKGGDKHLNEESCPPFCTCACCSVSRHFIASGELSFVVQEVEVPFVAYRMPAIAEQPIEIYQPPQIS